MQNWGQIGSAAARKDEMRLMDVASRIATGLEYSEMRLYDLAMSYSAQLHSHLSKDEPKPYQAFKDTLSPSVYKDIHALFWEMAVLRDVLAEFIAVFCLIRDDATTLSGLLRSLNKAPSTDPLAKEIILVADAGSPQGWLARFGSYRDCFTHSAPLEQVRGSAFAIQDLRILKDGALVPQIYFPLPKDPDALRRNRAKGVLFNSLKAMAEANAGKHDRAQEPDALEYLHGCLCQLTEFSTRLVSRSPIAPQPIVLTKKTSSEKSRSRTDKPISLRGRLLAKIPEGPNKIPESLKTLAGPSAEYKEAIEALNASTDEWHIHAEPSVRLDEWEMQVLTNEMGSRFNDQTRGVVFSK